MKYYEIENAPFEINGFPFRLENNNFNRLPERIMNVLPEQLRWVAPQPSGGVIRFRSDSKKLSLDVELTRNETSRTCSQALLSGFDVYVDLINGKGFQFAYNLCPENNPINFVIDMPWYLPEGLKEFKIYTPLQNPIKSLKIGLEKSAKVESPTSYSIQKPVLFYGSSITCGFSASRPGLTYPARITRELNLELINFGFGGAAKGELEVARSIAELELSCFVMDYDFNAPSVEHLQNTHFAFYEEIRSSRPDLPIILVSAPYYYKDVDGFTKRREVIEDTFKRGIDSGDQNLTFIDGGKFFSEIEWADFTVDLLHPNDMGFARMAELILPYVKQATGGNRNG